MAYSKTVQRIGSHNTPKNKNKKVTMGKVSQDPVAHSPSPTPAPVVKTHEGPPTPQPSGNSSTGPKTAPKGAAGKTAVPPRHTVVPEHSHPIRVQIEALLEPLQKSMAEQFTVLQQSKLVVEGIRTLQEECHRSDKEQHQALISTLRSNVSECEQQHSLTLQLCEAIQKQEDAVTTLRAMAAETRSCLDLRSELAPLREGFSLEQARRGVLALLLEESTSRHALVEEGLFTSIRILCEERSAAGKASRAVHTALRDHQKALQDATAQLDQWKLNASKEKETLQKEAQSREQQLQERLGIQEKLNSDSIRIIEQLSKQQHAPQDATKPPRAALVDCCFQVTPAKLGIKSAERATVCDAAQTTEPMSPESALASIASPVFSPPTRPHVKTHGETIRFGFCGAVPDGMSRTSSVASSMYSATAENSVGRSDSYCLTHTASGTLHEARDAARDLRRRLRAERAMSNEVSYSDANLEKQLSTFSNDEPSSPVPAIPAQH